MKGVISNEKQNTTKIIHSMCRKDDYIDSVTVFVQKAESIIRFTFEALIVFYRTEEAPLKNVEKKIISVIFFFCIVPSCSVPLVNTDVHFANY